MELNPKCLSGYKKVTRSCCRVSQVPFTPRILPKVFVCREWVTKPWERELGRPESLGTVKQGFHASEW